MQQLFRTAHRDNNGISVCSNPPETRCKLFLFPLGDDVEMICNGPDERCFISATTSIHTKLDAAII
jgi:hypothetical protein